MVSSAGVRVLAVSVTVNASDNSLVHVHTLYIFMVLVHCMLFFKL